MKLIYGLAAAAALASGALAQQPDADQMKKLMVEIQDMANAKMKAGALAAMGGVMTVVKNSPYMADQVSERTQTLADGTRIHTEDKVSVARDSQGRVRRETPERITIWDPVENATYILDPKNMSMAQTRVISKVAVNSGSASVLDDSQDVGFAVRQGGGAEMHQIVIAGPPPGLGPVSVEYKNAQDLATVKLRAAAANAAAANATSNAPAANKESLGSQRIEGVSAEGTRETQTIEAGAIGNDRPIQIVNERWYSPELQTDVMTRHADPRTGEQVVRLTNVRIGEPDPALFQVPAGYQKPPLPAIRHDQ